MENFINNPSVHRGIRNNNPGNLIRSSANWQGKIPFDQSQDNHFEQFVEMKYGVRAMMKDIINDVNKGTNTVKKLISEYAPSFENNTDAYINTVTSLIGLGLNELIDLSEETIVGLCKAIITVENGAKYANYVTQQDFQDALAILGVPLKKKRTPRQ